jgi:hypothetical protein
VIVVDFFSSNKVISPALRGKDLMEILMFTRVEFGGWQNCISLNNGKMELIVTTDVGPRIISCSFCGEANLFAVFESDLGRTGDPAWRPYGGHRLWHAPEDPVRTYFPDNSSVDASWDGTCLTLKQQPESITGIQKQMNIRMSPDHPVVQIEHILKNIGKKPTTLAPWALTVLAPGGRAVLPQEPYTPWPQGLLPSRPLVLWPYTDLHDPNLTFGKHLVQLRQDQQNTGCQKIGLRNTLNWGAYYIRDTAFIKTAELQKEALYPDFNSNWEVYTNSAMLELETLGPLQVIDPDGGLATHIETWILSRITPTDLEEVLAGEIERAIREGITN